MPTADRQTELNSMLRTLRLPAMATNYEALALKAAKANLTHETFLYELVRAECVQREEHRIDRLRRRSELPLEKTFRTLQMERFPPGIRQQVERLRGGAFLAAATNVVLRSSSTGSRWARRSLTLISSKPLLRGAAPSVLILMRTLIRR